MIPVVCLLRRYHGIERIANRSPRRRFLHGQRHGIFVEAAHHAAAPASRSPDGAQSAIRDSRAMRHNLATRHRLSRIFTTARPKGC
jgi:hypothetical protein